MEIGGIAVGNRGGSGGGAEDGWGNGHGVASDGDTGELRNKVGCPFSVELEVLVVGADAFGVDIEILEIGCGAVIVWVVAIAGENGS